MKEINYLNKYRLSFVLNMTIMTFLFFFSLNSCSFESVENQSTSKDTLVEYQAPDTSTLLNDEYGKLVKYGMKLFLNTAYYIGPNGTVGKFLGNEMNCTNCHLDAGAKTYGNSLFNTHKAYPQYRARENKVLTTADRVNNCIERPHNGKPMPLGSYEMLAFETYIHWLGKDYDPDIHYGHGIKKIEYAGKKADPLNGEMVYNKHCISCHLADGQGIYDSTSWHMTYPPLWGKQSYQKGSSMHRVLKSAGFIYHNMPRTVIWDKPQLTVQEALDVAAFINSEELHERPDEIGVSYPDISYKPIDYFKGPYNDTFSEYQHTFGPWDEMKVGGTK